MKTTVTFLLIAAVSISAFAQKWEKIQPNILFAQDKNQSFSTVKVGIRTDNPSAALDVNGRSRTRGNAFFDSLLTALQIQCATINVSGNAHVGGVFTVGNTLTFNGSTNSISSSSGTVDFGTNNITTGGTVTANTLNATQVVSSGVPLVSSQWTTSSNTIFYNNGTVAVGTTTPNTTAKLHVAGGSVRVDDGSIGVVTSLSTFPISVSSSTSNTLVAVRNTGQTAAGLFLTGGGAVTKGVIIHATGPGNLQGANKLVFRTSDSTDIYSQFLDGPKKGYLGLGTLDPSERLEVAGNVKVSGNMRLSNLAGTGDRQLVVDSSGNLRAIGGAINLCAGLDAFWKTNGNFLPALCNPFIGTTNAKELIFKTDANGSGGERMRITATGEVGIGTTLPFAKLHVVNFVSTGAIITTNHTFDYGYGILSEVNRDLTKAIVVRNNSTNKETFLVYGDGRVGIGTDPDGDPTFKLSVNGNTFLNGNVSIGPGKLAATGDFESVKDVFLATQFPSVVTIADNVKSATTYDTPDRLRFDVRGDGRFTSTANSANYVRVGYNSANAIIDNFGLGDLLINNYSGKNVSIGPGKLTATGDFESVRNTYLATGSGNVGIGDTYVPSGYKLAINGKAIAEEYVVRLRADWPDYVFCKDYKLTPLDELEKFVKSKKHLPGIPSVKEVADNGVSLGDMVTKQMEKIEELTLYLIQLNNDIQKLKLENEQLKAAIKK